MLTELTDYLLKHNKVVIPQMGTFELHHHPSQLDFAERQIHPPYHSIQYSRHDEPDINQSSKFGTHNLNDFGRNLKIYTQTNEFNWAGIGLLKTIDGKVIFQPTLRSQYFNQIEAHKVIRKQEEHEVLRGERAFSSTKLRNEQPVRKRRNYALLIAAIIGIMGAAYLIYHFSHYGFSVSSTGVRTRW